MTCLLYTSVDDVTYDVIELFEDNSAKEIIEKLVDRYPQTEIEEAIQEVNEMCIRDRCPRHATACT